MRTVDSPCQLHDVAATALLSAGFSHAEVGGWMPDARSLLEPDRLHERGYAACLYRNTGISYERKRRRKGYFDPPLHASMWLEGRFKLNVYHSPPPGPNACQGELFDMEADPLEMENLWDYPDHAEVRDRMGLRLMNWLALQDFQGRARGSEALPPGFGESLVSGKGA